MNRSCFMAAAVLAATLLLPVATASAQSRSAQLRPDASRHGGSRSLQRGLGADRLGDALRLAPRSQADDLLKRLGYAAAFGAGGQSALSRTGDAQLQANGLTVPSQAMRLRRELRFGGAGQDLTITPRLPTGLVPPMPGQALPQGWESANPAGNFQTVPGQDSPFTSSGNAAGYRPYSLPPGVKAP